VSSRRHSKLHSLNDKIVIGRRRRRHCPTDRLVGSQNACSQTQTEDRAKLKLAACRRHSPTSSSSPAGLRADNHVKTDLAPLIRLRRRALYKFVLID